MTCYNKNENVVAIENATPLFNSQIISSWGVCSKYFIKVHALLYAERFARRGDITIPKSTAIFNELKSKGYLNNRNYFIGFSNAMVNAYTTNYTAFSKFNSLTVLQKLNVIEQIDLSVSDYQIYSDYNQATLKFFNTQCI